MTEKKERDDGRLMRETPVAAVWMIHPVIGERCVCDPGAERTCRFVHLEKVYTGKGQAVACSCRVTKKGIGAECHHAHAPRYARAQGRTVELLIDPQVGPRDRGEHPEDR
jgi:hypothetical protein